MKTINLEATVENLEKIQDFIGQELKNWECDARAMLQLQMAVEEVYVNIAHYAYQPGPGPIAVSCEVMEDPLRVLIEFRDRGEPFDPLKKADVDISLRAEERQIGGLGIFLVKKVMDQVSYCYQDGQNVFRIEKVMTKKTGGFL